MDLPDHQYNFTHPYFAGAFNDWELTGKIFFSHLIRKVLGAHPSRTEVLLSHPPGDNHLDRQLQGELVDYFGFPTIYSVSGDVLAFYGARGIDAAEAKKGKGAKSVKQEDDEAALSGLVVDLGHSVSSVTPVHEGYALPHASVRLGFAGAHLTMLARDFLQQLDSKSGGMDEDDQTARRFKETQCYLASTHSEYEQTMMKIALGKTKKVDFEVKEDTSVAVGIERIDTGEALFNPAILHAREAKHAEGVASNIVNVLEDVDEDIRDILAQDMILTGGTSKFKGFTQRLHNEMNVLFGTAAGTETVKLRTYDDPELLSWYGAKELIEKKLLEEAPGVRKQTAY